MKVIASSRYEKSGGELFLLKKLIIVVFYLFAVPVFALAAPSGENIILSPTVPLSTTTQLLISQPILAKPIFTEPLRFALTFDDGPNPKYTPQILETLDRYGARGTFFMIGDNINQYPKLIQQVVANGNEIGGHSMTHPDPDEVSDSQLDYEITKSVTMLRSLSGKSVRYFRMPYGKGNYVYTKRGSELGVKLICWTIDTRDWTGISADIIAKRVLDKLEPNSIVLLHDGGGNRQETVNALETILREANNRGYSSVTLSELGI